MNFHTNDKYEHQIIGYFLSLQLPMQNPRIWIRWRTRTSKVIRHDPSKVQISIQIQSNDPLPKVGFWCFRFQAACWSSGRLFIIRAIIITDVRTLTAMGGHGWGMVMASNGGTPCPYNSIYLPKYAETFAPVSEEESLGINSGSSTKSFRFECVVWTKWSSCLKFSPQLTVPKHTPIEHWTLPSQQLHPSWTCSIVVWQPCAPQKMWQLWCRLSSLAKYIYIYIYINLLANSEGITIFCSLLFFPCHI